MNIATSNGMDILSLKLRSTLATINKDVDGLPEKLGADLGVAGIQPTGPMMFIYDGVTADPHNEFDLRIALPVSRADSDQYSGEARKDRLSPFKFVETVLHGDIGQLATKAYEPLFKEMGQTKLMPNGFGVEVYQNFVDVESEDNVTRVQVGVQSS